MTAASSAFAGTITAELNRTEGNLGEDFLLTVSVEGVRDGDLNPPQVPGLVINQQGVSESTIYTNGHRTSELQVTFAIYPQQAGAFTIPSLTLNLDGKAESSLPLTLTIHPAGQAPQAQQAPQARPSQQGTPPPKSTKKLEDTGGVYIERECNNTTPYVDEQVVCAIRVFHRGNLNGGERTSEASPEFRRFSVDGEKRYQKIVNGQRYSVIELKEIVIPTKSGKVSLPPFSINARILTYSRRKNPLDKFFENFGGMNFDLSFTEEKEAQIASEPTEFDVKPLPEQGKPKDFSGLVGNFQMTANLSRQRVPAGETVTITINLNGLGVSDTMQDPPLNVSTLGKVYADKPEYKEEVNADQGVRSTRTYKYALVPRAAGQYPLGSVDIPIFNPKLQQYTTLHADLGNLIVDPGKTEEQPLVVGQTPGVGGGKEDVKELGKELLGPHREVALDKKQTITSVDKALYVGFGSTPTLFACCAFGFLGWQERRRGDPAGLRRSRAYRAFKETLGGAEAQAAAGRIDGAFAAAYAAFRDYLGDKLGLHGRSLAAREIAEQLTRFGASAELREKAAQLVGGFEQVEFGGQAPPAGRAAEILKELDAVVGGLEKV